MKVGRHGGVGGEVPGAGSGGLTPRPLKDAVR